jgi:N-acetylglucosaminyldiphosphoundecaprenol N-acetyl-beta-D-mannosaminyltransferase
MGLTWAYRLCREPLRLGPRYLRYNSIFLFYLLWDVLLGLWPGRWKSYLQK